MNSPRTSWTRVWLPVAVVALLTLLTAPGAGAVTVTIGSPLTGPFSPGSSGMPATWTNTVLPPGASLKSPNDGTIVRWRIVGASGGPFYLRVLTPDGGTTYTGAGTGPAQFPTTSGTQTFPASLPIGAGQIVGFDNTGTMDTFAFATVPGATYTDWNPPLADGSALPYTNPYGAGGELAFNADVRYCVVPALTGKKLGAAKRALAAADCALGKIVRPKKKARRKKAEVRAGRERRRGELDLGHRARRPDARQEASQEEALDGRETRPQTRPRGGVPFVGRAVLTDQIL